MPNCNGAAVLDGCTFREFLERMGGYLLFPDRPPGNSADTWDAKLQREFKELTRMPVGQALALYEQKAAEFYLQQMESDRRYRAQRKEKLSKYRAMVNQVRAWKAPRVLADVKKRMLEELRTNMRFDCRPSGPRPRRMSGPEFLAFMHEQLERAARTSAKDAQMGRALRRKNTARATAMRQELERLEEHQIA